jgi:hypothetical protein
VTVCKNTGADDGDLYRSSRHTMFFFESESERSKRCWPSSHTPRRPFIRRCFKRCVTLMQG